jgi:hypothetical protein
VNASSPAHGVPGSANVHATYATVAAGHESPVDACETDPPRIVGEDWSFASAPSDAASVRAAI